jgi:DoxX-like family
MGSVANTSADQPRAGKKLNVVLWILQGLLAALFLFAGGVKLVIPLAAMAQQIGLPVWFLRFVAVCEILGGLGLILPGITKIRRELAAIAAACLVIIMIGATWLSLPGGVKSAATPFVTGVLCAFVGYARWKIAPHR